MLAEEVIYVKIAVRAVSTEGGGREDLPLGALLKEHAVGEVAPPFPRMLVGIRAHTGLMFGPVPLKIRSTSGREEVKVGVNVPAAWTRS